MRFDFFSHCAFSLVLSVGLVGVNLHAEAAVVSWSGGGADQNWTTGGAGGNWSGDALPGAADTAVFTHVAGGGSAGTVTNVVPGSYTVHTLSYQLDTTTPTGFFHTTQIAAGQTLLVTEGLNVSPFSVGTHATNDNQQNGTFPNHVSVVGPTSTLQVGNTGTNTAGMVLGLSAQSGSHHTYSSHSIAKLDLSGLGTFVANVNLLSLGRGIEASNLGYAEITLAPNTEINAKTIETSRGTGYATVLLGQDSTIRVNTMYVNMGKAGVASAGFRNEVRFQTGLTNPVLDLSGLDNVGANLLIGANTTNNTGGTSVGIMDLSGGTFNATLADLTIGWFNQPGTGTPPAGSTIAPNGGAQGTLIMDAGSVTANNVILAKRTAGNPTSTRGTITMRGGTFAVIGSVTDGGGVSTLQIDGGTMTIANGLQVDNLRVAYDGTSANLTVTGGDVVIGTGTETFDLARRPVASTASTATVNFSGAASVVINVNELQFSRVDVGSAASQGILTMPSTGPATIVANSIIIGDTPLAGASGDSYLHFGGGVADVHVDNFYVGYRKQNATIDLLPGGVLNIAGRSGAAANLYVGYNAVHTSGAKTGTMDLSGGTFNAVLNNLIVGYHTRTSNNSGSGTGLLTFDAGTISANSVVIGSGSSTYDGEGLGTVNMNGGSLTAGGITLGAGNSNTSGTFNLAGGTLSAGSIVRGVAGSTTAFNFTGGTLRVDQFGSVALPFDLVQQGGMLAPGRSIGTTAIYGNYTQAAAGAIEIEIAGLTEYDLVAVNGNASLSGTLNVLLLDSYTAALGDYFDILTTTGDLTVDFAGITGDAPNPVFGWWEASIVEAVDGFALRLSAVPEPSSMVLVLLGIAILVGRRRR